MRQKKPHFVITFYTTAEAIATEKLCKEKGIDGKLISAPRSVSADCGISWCTTPELKGATVEAVTDAGIEVQDFHDLEL